MITAAKKIVDKRSQNLTAYTKGSIYPGGMMFTVIKSYPDTILVSKSKGWKLIPVSINLKMKYDGIVHLYFQGIMTYRAEGDSTLFNSEINYLFRVWLSANDVIQATHSKMYAIMLKKRKHTIRVYVRDSHSKGNALIGNPKITAIGYRM